MAHDTSRAAFESLRPHLNRLQREVFGYVSARGTKGMTCDEIETQTGLAHQTASARIYELARSGVITDSGQRRPTISGRKAIVWVKG
jgi:hypothetical protein